MNKLTRNVTIGGLIVISLLIYLIIQGSKPQEISLGVNPEYPTTYINYSRDLIGTKTGTSTVGEAYYATTTTADIAKIGRHINEAVLTFSAQEASSTTGYVEIQILGSNDFLCDTATTSFDYGNPILMSDINWFDIGHNILNKAGATTIGATTTVTWTPTHVDNNTTIVLDKLNYECIKLHVKAGFVKLWSQIITK